MASTTVSVYDQFDFVPDEIMATINHTGNMVQPIFEWLQIPQGLAVAVMNAIGGLSQ